MYIIETKNYGMINLRGFMVLTDTTEEIIVNFTPFNEKFKPFDMVGYVSEDFVNPQMFNEIFGGEDIDTVIKNNLKNPTYDEVLSSIGIGFCQPKFYKRNVWLKSKKIMDKLCELNVGVVPFDYGRGKGKYSTTKKLDHKDLTLKYLKS